MDYPLILWQIHTHMNCPQKGEGFPGQRIVVLPGSVVARAMVNPLLGGLFPTDVGYFPNAIGHLRERPEGAETINFHLLHPRQRVV